MNSSRANPKEGQFATVALALIVFPILVAVAYYASRKLLPQITNFQLAPHVGKGTFQNATSAAATQHLLNATARPLFLNFSLPRIPMLTYSDLLIIIAGVVVLYICLQTFRVISGRLRIKPISDIDILEEDRQKVAEILDDAARKLALGSDYRDTVLKCYKSIVRVLEVRSTLQSKTLTPSEFKEIVSRKLEFDSPSFSKVTSLFEIARYSENEITKENAEDAIESLTTLSRELLSKDIVSTS
ncbi:MAG: DUF4129 domain-containing protein [Nitrososphaerota archaeon]|nr:DUF4129 domain-containing protein [Nitrososphaerota archaeon]